MQSKHSNPSVSSSNPSTQASALSGFKFATIGHNPSLLERMSDGPPVSFSLRPSDQNSSQEQNSASHTPFRPNQAQPMAMGAPLTERGLSVKPILTQNLNSLPPTFTSLSSSKPPNNDVKAPQPLDQIRASVIPDLQYPNPTPEIGSPHRESPTTHPQSHLQSVPVPMDQDTSHQPRPPVPRALLTPTSSAPVGPGFAGNSSTLSSQTTSSEHSSSVASSTEPEQLRRPVEHLFKLASAREERLSKTRETFDLRSGELSTFGTDASRSIQDLQDRIEISKHHAEEMRAQAELTLREANKMRDMADHLIVSIGALGVEMLGAKSHVGRAVERSEQLTRYVRKSFDWLATLRGHEQEKIAVIQADIVEQERAEQERAELLRRQQELQQQLERRKIEEQEKMEAAKREEEAREAARKAEQEREAARKAEEEREVARKAEEEREAARKKAYEIRRAEVMAEKRRATEAQAYTIQAERERRVADVSSPSSKPSIRGSNAPLSTSPAPTPEVAHSIGASTDVPFQQATVPTPSRSPVARTGGSSETAPPFPSPQPLPNKVKPIPTHVSFVPAQTEAGRAVNTDSPLSSTTLASELHSRNVVEAPRHPHSSHIMRDLAEEGMMQFQRPSQAAPTLEPRQVEIKREPSVGELPPPRSQPLQDTANIDHSPDHRHMAVPRTPSQDRDQQALPSSTSGSRATSLHIAQAEDHRYRTGVSAQGDPHHLDDPLHDHVVPGMNGRAYARERSVSSDRSVSPWHYRDQRSRSPLSPRDDRSRSPSRSPPHRRKRTRSRTPPRFLDHWEPDRSRIRPRVDDDWNRTRYNGHERRRRGDSPHRYRGLPPRRVYNTYRPSPSPPLSPRQFRNERSPPRRVYYDRSLAAEHVPQRYVETDPREWRTDDHRANINARHNEPAYEGGEAYRTVEKEQQQRWPQPQWQRRSSSPSEREQTSTSSPRHGEVDIGLLDRINMNESDDRGRGRGRPPPGTARGGPNTRRGTRGGSSSGRGRAGAPALLSRMTETAARPMRPAPALSLSDRMEQD